MDRLDLRDIPLFSGFSAEAIGFLEGRLKQIALEPGQPLATAGSAATSIIFVSQGWVRLLDTSGREIARSGPGSIIGEADALSAQAYSVGASAVTRVRALHLPMDAIRDLVHRFPSTIVTLDVSLGYRPVAALQGLADWLGEVEGLTDEAPERLLDLAGQLQPLSLSSGQTVRGALRSGLLVLEGGAIEVQRTDGQPEVMQGTCVLVDWPLISGGVSTQTVKAVSATVGWYLAADACSRLRADGLGILANPPEPAVPEEVAPPPSRVAPKPAVPPAKARPAAGAPVAPETPERVTPVPVSVDDQPTARVAAGGGREPNGQPTAWTSEAAAPIRAATPPAETAVRPASQATRRPARAKSGGLSVWLQGLSGGGRVRLLVAGVLLIWIVAAGIFALTGATAQGASGQQTRDLSQYRATALAMTPSVVAQAIVPTATFAPSPTPLPTSTPTMTPTATATATPTDTPVPTDTAEPTATPRPTKAPENIPAAQAAAPTDTPVPAEPAPTATPSVTYRLASWRKLTACENQGNHVLMINVVDAAGNGIAGVPLVIQWGGESATIYTGEKMDKGPGWAEWPMYGGYTVYVGDGTSETSPNLSSKIGPDEKCESTNNPVGNSYGHNSYEVIFQRAY